MGGIEKSKTDKLHALQSLVFMHGGMNVLLGPYIPLYLVNKGLSPIDVGIILGVGPFVGLLSQPLWAITSDVLKTIKKTLLIAFLFAGIATAAVSMSQNFYTVFVCMIFVFFSWAATAPLLESMNIVHTRNSSYSYGNIRAMASLGFAGMAFAAGIILEKIGINHIHYLWWATVFLLVLSLLKVKDIKPANSKLKKEDMLQLLQNKAFLWTVVTIFFLSIPNGFNNVMFGIYMQDLGAKENLIGLAIMLSAGSEVPVFYFLSRRIEKMNKDFVLGLVSVIYLLRWVITAYLASPVLLALFQVTNGITFSVFWIAAIKVVVEIVPDQLQNTGQALLAAITMGVVAIIGSFAGGWVYESYGGHVMYLIMSLITLVAAILLISTYIVKNKQVIHIKD